MASFSRNWALLILNRLQNSEFLNFGHYCLRGGGVLRFGLDGSLPLEPRNPYPSLRVILAEKGTHLPNSVTVGFQASHKQWEVAILILINTVTSINSRIVNIYDWLKLNKHPCWDSIHDPFASEANPWTAGLCYLF